MKAKPTTRTTDYTFQTVVRRKTGDVVESCRGNFTYTVKRRKKPAYMKAGPCVSVPIN